MSLGLLEARAAILIIRPEDLMMNPVTLFLYLDYLDLYFNFGKYSFISFKFVLDVIIRPIVSFKKFVSLNLYYCALLNLILCLLLFMGLHLN